MSSADRRVGPSAQHVRRTNPRAARTRAIVIAAARKLIAEVGISGFSYTSVAKRSGVTRQTLYRHWPQREQLLRDILLEGPDNYAEPGTLKVRAILMQTLRRFTEWMDRPANSMLVLVLMNQAESDDAAADAELALLVERGLNELNNQLKDTDVALDSVGFSQLIGPVTLHRFLNRGPITQDFLELTVDRFLAAAPPTASIRVREPGRPTAKV